MAIRKIFQTDAIYWDVQGLKMIIHSKELVHSATKTELAVDIISWVVSSRENTYSWSLELGSVIRFPVLNWHWCYSQLFLELGDVSVSLGDNLYIELLWYTKYCIKIQKFTLLFFKDKIRLRHKWNLILNKPSAINIYQCINVVQNVYMWAMELQS